MNVDVWAVALKHPVLTKEAEVELCTAYAAARDEHGAQSPQAIKLRNKLVTSNLRAVAKHAKRYRRLSFDDLMSEGVKGLIVAAERYEVERGLRFGTFAQWWVRHKLQRACEDFGSAVRVPVWRQGALYRGEIERDGVSVEGGLAQSLDAPLNEDGGCLYDLLSTGAESVANDLCSLEAASSLRRAVLSVLTPREREIIESRYLRAKEETLSEVAARLGGLSRERIRQVQEESLRKLRRELKRVGVSREGV